MKTEIAIVGGGIIGISAAYVLAKRGCSVQVIEAREIGSGSSHGNAGLICPCHPKPIPGPGVLAQGLRWMLSPASPFYIQPRLDKTLFRWLLEFRKHCNSDSVDAAIPLLRDMQRESLLRYESWIKDCGIDAEFEKKGGIELYLTRQKFGGAPAEVDHLLKFGINVEMLSRDQVLALEPAVSPNVVGGIHYKEDAHINPAKFIRELTLAAENSGAQIQPNTSARNFVRTGSKIEKIVTSKGDIHAEEFIIAAGAWTPQLAKTAGIDLLMQPGKGYSITMHEPELSPRIPLHLAEARMAITPMGQTLRFAGTMELSGINNKLRSRRIEAVRMGGFRYLAAEERPSEIEIWSGLRPIPPDGLPYIGRPEKIGNLTIATGHAMLGISMGPFTGEIIAEIVQGAGRTPNLAPFNIDRFNSK